jgi:hypothetical protein
VTGTPEIPDPFERGAFLHQAAEQIRMVRDLTDRLATQAQGMRQGGHAAEAAVMEEEVDRRRRWITDRFLALAAIEAGVPLNLAAPEEGPDD